MLQRVFLCGAAVCGLVTAGLACALFGYAPARADDPADVAGDDSAEPRAVEDDMHEFMEYVYEPAFKRLKPLMATTPADNAAWKGIKADSLALAESGNLLLLRAPDKEGDAWREHAVQTRDLGGKLYRAAKTKDFAAAREHYTAMIAQCNKCHVQFAAGEHQLAP